MFVATNGLKYLIQGFIVGLASMFIAPDIVTQRDAFFIGVVASITFMFLDMFSSSEVDIQTEIEAEAESEMSSEEEEALAETGEEALAETGAEALAEALAETGVGMEEGTLAEAETGNVIGDGSGAGSGAETEQAIGIRPTELGGVPYKLRPGHYSKVIVLPGYNEYVAPANIDFSFYANRASYPSKLTTVKATCGYTNN